MPTPFVPLTLEQLAERLRAFHFTRPVTAVHMHHTWRPRHADYDGERTIDAMWRHHTQVRGWSDIAQHLSIAPDGTIWTGRDWNRAPASATGHNDGVFMFETIGDFDTGRDRLTGVQRDTVAGVVALVQLRCGLAPESLRFHRDFTTAKSCPGTSVVYAEMLDAVRAARARLGQMGPTLAERDLEATSAAVGGAPASRSATVYAAPGHEVADVSVASNGERTRKPFADSELEPAPSAAGADPTGTTGTAAARDEGELACDGVAAVDAGRDAPRDSGRDAVRGGFRPEELSFLRRHVINLRQGRFSGGGVMSTSAGDVDAIFHEHLPRALADAGARGEPLRLLFYAHGGLVAEERGLAMARDLVPWWTENRVYPVYFVWETGLWETITQLLRGRRELAPARDLADVSDRAIEEVARRVGGGRLWDGMKFSAQRAVDADGGARYAAERLAELCRRHPGEVELHAVGHSAGSIFHSHFVPAALDLGVPRFATLSLLAPAVRVDAFVDRLAPRIEGGRGVGALSIYTMSKEFELADNCGRVYRKSLLYLVRHAFEAERRADILGLEESIRANPTVARLVGLAGDGGSPHEVIWSRSRATAGRRASAATTHGGFDNDRLTMEGVLRRVLGAADDAAIRPFPEHATRALHLDLAGDAELPTDPPVSRPPAPAPIAVATSGGGAAAVHAGDAGGALARPPRLRRALCVGIDAYEGSARLGGCVADARMWAAQLEALGFERVDLLLDARATEDGIRRTLTELVASGGPGDALVFQYAGHGTFFRDEDGDDEDGQDEALVPVDFHRGAILLDDEQFRLFDQLPTGASLTCFYDCCHSGTMARFAIQSMLQEARSLDRVDDVRPRFIDPTPAMWAEYERRREGRRERGLVRRGVRDRSANKAVVFSACRDDEVALERGGQGVFTSRVARLLGDAYRRGVSNAEFMRQITEAFGARPSQHPGLDCAPQAEGRALLRPAGGSAPRPKRGRKNGARPGTHAALHDTLHQLPRAELLAVIQEASALLSDG